MRLVGAIVILALAIGWGSVPEGPVKTADTFVDVSWPNCSLSKPPYANFGIVGINGGLALRPNPCLAKQTGWFRQASAYVNTGYPGPERAMKFQHWPKNCLSTDEGCLAYNYGYNSGLYDIKYALVQGVVADRWWLDVETENSWSDSTEVNRSALQGMQDAISRFAGAERVGYYSYPGQWNLITGRWQNHMPSWVATGSSEKSSARRACLATGFTGGPVIMAQYLQSLDQNYPCD